MPGLTKHPQVRGRVRPNRDLARMFHGGEKKPPPAHREQASSASPEASMPNCMGWEASDDDHSFACNVLTSSGSSPLAEGRRAGTRAFATSCLRLRARIRFLSTSYRYSPERTKAKGHERPDPERGPSGLHPDRSPSSPVRRSCIVRRSGVCRPPPSPYKLGGLDREQQLHHR